MDDGSLHSCQTCHPSVVVHLQAQPHLPARPHLPPLVLVYQGSEDLLAQEMLIAQAWVVASGVRILDIVQISRYYEKRRERISRHLPLQALVHQGSEGLLAEEMLIARAWGDASAVRIQDIVLTSLCQSSRLSMWFSKLRSSLIVHCLCKF